MRANLPHDEVERLAALSRYNVLDTPHEISYDRVTRTARHVFNVPISVVTLVDGRRQFFKSKIGVEISETPRDQAFCAHGLLQEDALIVPDAAADPRFADNPLVTGDPHIRFYAGAQLKTQDGFKLGSLCVVDTVPRPRPTPEEISVLEDLAAQVVQLLEERRTQQEITGLRSALDGARTTLLAHRQRWQKTEQAAALALDAGKMGFWEFEEASKQAQWSERMFAIMGFPVAQTPPSLRHLRARLHRDDLSRVLHQLNVARQKREAFTLKCRLVKPDGSERSVTTIGDHYLAEDGTPLGALGVTWDSTEMDRKERALEESEELFRALSSSCPVGIFRTDMAGNVTYANPRLSEIWETSMFGPMDGLAWQKRIQTDDLPKMLSDIATALRETGCDEREYRLLSSDGSIRWIHSRTVVLRDRNGLAVGTVGTVDDITERKKAVADLRAAKEAAELASRSKDIFLSNVSHELRTPLNGVLGMAELLLDTPLEPDQVQMAEIVRDSGRSLLAVVNDILDLSRIEGSKLSIEDAPFYWSATLADVLALVRQQAEAKGIRLELEQNVKTAERLVGDEARIKQILVVYLTNALKFTKSGKVTVKVDQVPVDASHLELLMLVHDTGPGILLEDQAKLFQPFSQIDPSTTRRYGGLGLGLAIARRLAELMGGSVGVISSHGNGATFWLRLTLPICDEASMMTRQLSAPDTSVVGSTRRVLIVEDNLQNQQVALHMLGKLGWQSDLAADGLVALDLVRRNEYAMVLMDCQMPELDGYRATEAIRAWERVHRNHSYVPIVALTAHAMNGDRERCLGAGMNDYLAKPIRFQELRTALDRWANRSTQDVPTTMLA